MVCDCRLVSDNGNKPGSENRCYEDGHTGRINDVCSGSKGDIVG